jgi:hypothetical protein
MTSHVLALRRTKACVIDRHQQKDHTDHILDDFCRFGNCRAPCFLPPSCFWKRRPEVFHELVRVLLQVGRQLVEQLLCVQLLKGQAKAGDPSLSWMVNLAKGLCRGNLIRSRGLKQARLMASRKERINPQPEHRAKFVSGGNKRHCAQAEFGKSVWAQKRRECKRTRVSERYAQQTSQQTHTR